MTTDIILVIVASVLGIILQAFCMIVGGIIGGASGILAGLYLFIYRPYATEMKTYGANPKTFCEFLKDVLR